MNRFINKSIHDVNTFLEKWVHSIDSSSTVTFDRPSESDSLTVNAYLFRISPSPVRDTVADSPMQVVLEYIITTWDGETNHEHTLLSDLIFSSYQQSEFETRFVQSNDALFSGLGIAIRPAFIIAVLLPRERKWPEPKLVRHKPVLQSAFMRQSRGVVVDGNDKPVSDVSVSIPSYEISSVTAKDGSFAAPVSPADVSVKQLADGVLVEKNGSEKKVKSVVLTTEDNFFTLKIVLEV